MRCVAVRFIHVAILIQIQCVVPRCNDYEHALSVGVVEYARDQVDVTTVARLGEASAQAQVADVGTVIGGIQNAGKNSAEWSNSQPVEHLHADECGFGRDAGKRDCLAAHLRCDVGTVTVVIGDQVARRKEMRGNRIVRRHEGRGARQVDESVQIGRIVVDSAIHDRDCDTRRAELAGGPRLVSADQAHVPLPRETARCGWIALTRRGVVHDRSHRVVDGRHRKIERDLDVRLDVVHALEAGQLRGVGVADVAHHRESGAGMHALELAAEVRDLTREITSEAGTAGQDVATTDVACRAEYVPRRAYGGCNWIGAVRRARYERDCSGDSNNDTVTVVQLDLPALAGNR